MYVQIQVNFGSFLTRCICQIWVIHQVPWRYMSQSGEIFDRVQLGLAWFSTWFKVASQHLISIANIYIYATSPIHCSHARTWQQARHRSGWTKTVCEHQLTFLLGVDSSLLKLISDPHNANSGHQQSCNWGNNTRNQTCIYVFANVNG